MTHHVTDMAVIGAGTAGLSAERTARQVGARTLLIDERFRGTLCANAGCMPSSLLIAAANAVHQARSAGQLGIKVGDVEVDGPARTRQTAIGPFAAGPLCAPISVIRLLIR